MEAQPVFVYGTLRRGGSNHFRMDGAEFIGAGSVAGRIHRIDWYPALSLGGEGRVRGELYRVCAEHLRALDEFEGILPDAREPREYHRVMTEVRLDSGVLQSAWVWEWIGNLGAAEALESGDWLDHEPNPG